MSKNRYSILMDAERDFMAGKISEERYKEICNECDYLEVIDECRDYPEAEEEIEVEDE